MAAKKDAKKSGKRSTSSSNGALEIETESNILKVTALEKRERANRSIGEKIAEVVAAFCGSLTFVWVHVVWFGGWIIFNSVSRSTEFDPFPFTFLTLVVSLEAIFLSTFILISQNHETRLTERRNHLDLQINMLAEQENTKTLELLQLIAEKVGVECDDPDTRALLEPMEPDKLVDQIVSATGDEGKKARSSARKR